MTMATITEDYVSFETAKLLQKNNAEFITDHFYNPNGRALTMLDDRDYIVLGYYKMPSLQMAMKWLREVHNIHIELNPICEGDTEEDIKWHYGWAVKTTIFIDRWKRRNAEHISYEQACEAAIKYCLENLIK